MQKKVAFMISSLSGGGAERVVSNLSLHLDDKIERYILLHSCEKIDYPYKGELIELNSRKKSEVRGLLQKLHYYFRCVNTARSIKAKHKIQVCVSFLSISNLVNIFSGSEGKVILSVRDYTSRKEIKGFYDRMGIFLLRLFYNRANMIIAVSQGVKKDLIKNYGVDEEKVEVIYNPYDIESIRQSMHEDLDEKYKPIFCNPVIINVGRLTHLKGQRHLIRALFEVKKHHQNTKLVFLGRGELEYELRRTVTELNLENDVFFLGFQENPFKFVKRSTAYVFPSLSEGFPNALVEAMACGIPVISADCRSGPREILAPDSDVDRETNTIEYAPYGILVPVCDGKNHDTASPLTPQESLLADSIMKLLENDDLREKYSLAAETRASDFNLENIIPHWEKIIERNIR